MLPSLNQSWHVTTVMIHTATLMVAYILIIPVCLQILYITIRGISVNTNSFRLAVYNDLFMQSSYPVTVHSGVNDGMSIITLNTAGSGTYL